MGYKNRKKTKDVRVEIKGKQLGRVRTRKPVKVGDYYYSNIPIKSLIRKAAGFGMTVADFLFNYELVVQEVVPDDGGIADSVTLLSWRRRQN